MLPLLSVGLSLQRALLVHGRLTAPITWATAAEVIGILVILEICISVFGMVGATAAGVAFIGGRLVSNLLLLPPCARVLRVE